MNPVVQQAEFSIETALQQTAEPATEKLNIAEARENLTELVNKVALHGRRLVVMRRGKELAALVPMADLVTLLSVEIPRMVVTQDARCFSLTLRGASTASTENEGETTENP